MLSRRSFLRNMVLTGVALAYGNGFGLAKNKTGNTDALFPVHINSKGGYIDIEGNFIVKPQFDGASYFREGLAFVRVGEKWGCIDKSGDFRIPPMPMEWQDGFWDGLAGVMPSGSNKWGYIDKTGTMVIEPRFKGSCGFSEGLCACETDDGWWGFIDRTSRWVISPMFKFTAGFSEGLAYAKVDGKKGFIDKNGTFVIPPIYRSSEYRFSEGLAPVGFGERENMFIDRTGKITIMNNEFEMVGTFTEGVAGVNIKGKVGFINKDGQIIIEPKFDCCSYFSEGLAVAVYKGKNGFEDKKEGFLNKNGDIVIEPKYDFALPFENGLSSVWIGERQGYINKACEYVWEPTA